MRISPLKPAALAVLASIAVACAAPPAHQDLAARFPAQAPQAAARAATGRAHCRVRRTAKPAKL